MSKFIPREKLGKKARREQDRKKRMTWDGVNPVTKKIESKKIYNRKKAWKGFDNSSSGPFAFIHRETVLVADRSFCCNPSGEKRLCRLRWVVTLAAVLIILSGCSYGFMRQGGGGQPPAASSNYRVTPRKYTLKPAVTTPRFEKDYTVMLYMNGSDLESKYGAATDDLIEMAESNFDGKNINLVIFTGGARRWHLDFIPDKVNTIFTMEDGNMRRLAEAGTDSMGSPEVLAGFVNFCKAYFPARNYGLIFWNHGGGAIVGYGSDERYEDNPDLAMMKLTDIDRSLEASAPTGGFQFIGFDTCLMATLEMAAISAKYGDYLVASEELEPGHGWDYSFLGEIKPGDTGGDIGRVIIDYFRDFYTNSEMDDIATLSMTQLSKIPPAYEAFEALASAAGTALSDGKYNLISKARASSRAFGGGQDGETDMIDLVQLADSLGDLFPQESKALKDAVGNAVIYKYDNYPGEIGGLSVYFPFENKENIDYYVEVYRSMGQLPNYSSFIEDFSLMLTDSLASDFNRPGSRYAGNHDGKIQLSEEQIDNLSDIALSAWIEPIELGFQRDGDYLIKLLESGEVELDANNRVTASVVNPVCLSGQTVCAYEIARNGERIRYKIPATLNGEDVHLIAVYCDEYPDGKVIGAIPLSDNIFNMLDKKMVSIKDGDEIKPRYYARPALSINRRQEDSKWFLGEPIVVSGEMNLSRENPNRRKLRYMLNFVDVRKNDNYLPVEFS